MTRAQVLGLLVVSMLNRAWPSLASYAKMEIHKEADLMKGEGHIGLKLIDWRLFPK